MILETGGLGGDTREVLAPDFVKMLRFLESCITFTSVPPRLSAMSAIAMN